MTVSARSVSVNGREQAVADGETVAGLLERLGLGAAYEPVERALYEEVRLEDGDHLVVARPVAGG